MRVAGIRANRNISGVIGSNIGTEFYVVPSKKRNMSFVRIDFSRRHIRTDRNVAACRKNQARIRPRDTDSSLDVKRIENLDVARCLKIDLIEAVKGATCLRIKRYGSCLVRIIK